MAEAIVSEGGRVVIPAELRARHGIRVGDRLVWIDEGDRLVLTTLRASIRSAQRIFATYDSGPKRSLADELIRERRDAAARE